MCSGKIKLDPREGDWEEGRLAGREPPRTAAAPGERKEVLAMA